MRRTNPMIAAALSLGLTLGAAACEENSGDGALEEAGEAIEEAGEEAGEAVGEGMEAAGEAIDQVDEASGAVRRLVVSLSHAVRSMRRATARRTA